jgi:transcriptional regulator with XRE-family HTH domain
VAQEASALGEYLRARRERLLPEDVGLAATKRRRVAGLRREELATLAGISAAYYLRLEQGRAISPSTQVVTRLRGLFGLTPDPRSIFTTWQLRRDEIFPIPTYRDTHLRR